MSKVFVSLCFSVLVCGCGSFRFTSTIRPSKDPNLSMGDVRFYIHSMPKVKKRHAMDPTLAVGTIRSEFRDRYPQIFSEDLSALPIRLEITMSKMRTSVFTTIIATFITGLGILPIPGWSEWDIHIKAAIPTESGLVQLGETSLTRRDSGWITIFSPLGFLPVLGFSDIPRGYWLMTGENNVPPFQPRVDAYTNACIAEALTQLLRKADIGTLQKIRDHRKTRVTQITQDGLSYWVYLAFVLQNKLPEEPAYTAVAYIYRTAPTWSTPSLQTIVVARRGEDGHWRPRDGYLRKAPTLTAATVLMEDGRPGKVIFKAVPEPPLEDFIDLPQVPAKGLVEYIKWSNGALLQVKNASLPRLLAEKSRSELTQLATRIEQAILDLNSKAELAKDQAQRTIENKGDPAPARALSIVYQQRIEVFRPILSVIKQGIIQKQ